MAAFTKSGHASYFAVGCARYGCCSHLNSGPAVLLAEKGPILVIIEIFLVVSIIAAVFGFGGIAAASADIARVLFYIFVVIFVVLLILGLVAARRV